MTCSTDSTLDDLIGFSRASCLYYVVLCLSLFSVQVTAVSWMSYISVYFLHMTPGRRTTITIPPWNPLKVMIGGSFLVCPHCDRLGCRNVDIHLATVSFWRYLWIIVVDIYVYFSYHDIAVCTGDGL